MISDSDSVTTLRPIVEKFLGRPVPDMENPALSLKDVLNRIESEVAYMRGLSARYATGEISETEFRTGVEKRLGGIQI